VWCVMCDVIAMRHDVVHVMVWWCVVCVWCVCDVCGV